MPTLISTPDRAERRRWTIVGLLRRFPNACIDGLILWALTQDRSERREIHPMRSGLTTKSCRADRDRCGACYCGKFQDKPRLEREQAEWDAQYPAPPTEPIGDAR
jgi:hypothetical protein